MVDIVLVDMKTSWKQIVQRVVSNAETAVRYFVLYMLFYLTNGFLAENGNNYITTELQSATSLPVPLCFDIWANRKAKG